MQTCLFMGEKRVRWEGGKGGGRNGMRTKLNNEGSTYIEKEKIKRYARAETTYIYSYG